MLRPTFPVKHHPLRNKFKELAALALGVGTIAFAVVVGIYLAFQFNGGLAALVRFLKAFL